MARRRQGLFTKIRIPSSASSHMKCGAPSDSSSIPGCIRWVGRAIRPSKFFRENAAKTDQDIIVEVDRYIVWPGQALGYKMGELKIRELRTKAERQLGSGFDIRKFHDTVLGHGAVPLDMLEQQVNVWIQNALK